MTKDECIERAKRCTTAAEDATKRAAALACTLGGKNDLTLRALADVAAANDAAHAWGKLADMHPQSRAKLLRDESLPTAIFGY